MACAAPNQSKVKGLAVCNEPSRTIPSKVLAEFYDQASLVDEGWWWSWSWNKTKKICKSLLSLIITLLLEVCCWDANSWNLVDFLAISIPVRLWASLELPGWQRIGPQPTCFFFCFFASKHRGALETWEVFMLGQIFCSQFMSWIDLGRLHRKYQWTLLKSWFVVGRMIVDCVSGCHVLCMFKILVWLGVKQHFAGEVLVAAV